MSVPTPRNLMVSTPGIGKEVSVVPEYEEALQDLKREERKGHFYARMALKQLEALGTGLAGKNNVFIPNFNDYKANTFQKVVVYVPGIQAVVERRANDSLKVTHLTLSDEFDTLNPKFKPGVYHATLNGDEINARYKSNGRITPENRVTVMVCDTNHTKPTEAAEEAFNKLGKMGKKGAAESGECNIFYSPMGKRMGMNNYNPAVEKEAYAFAGLLADAIEQSQKQKGVEWLSELGGSAILTQGLQTLANKGMSLKNQGHRVEMYMPTTDPRPTLMAAQKLGMIADKNIAMGNGSIKPSISSIMVNYARAKNKEDHYSFSDYGKDLATGSLGIMGVAGAIGLSASSVATLPALTTVGAVTGAVGAAATLLGVFKNSRARRGK